MTGSSCVLQGTVGVFEVLVLVFFLSFAAIRKGFERDENRHARRERGFCLLCGIGSLLTSANREIMSSTGRLLPRLR